VIQRAVGKRLGLPLAGLRLLVRTANSKYTVMVNKTIVVTAQGWQLRAARTLSALLAAFFLGFCVRVDRTIQNGPETASVRIQVGFVNAPITV
jgi:hypothetical protein